MDTTNNTYVKQVTTYEVKLLICEESPRTGHFEHTRKFDNEADATAYVNEVREAIQYSSDNEASRQLARHFVGQWGSAYIKGIYRADGFLVYA